MSQLPQVMPDGLRLARQDYVDASNTIKWQDNSCWVDTALWLMKFCKVAQLECDKGHQGAEPEERATHELLNSSWTERSTKELTAAKHEILRLCLGPDELGSPCRYGMGGVAACIGGTAGELPSVHIRYAYYDCCSNSECDAVGFTQRGQAHDVWFLAPQDGSQDKRIRSEKPIWYEMLDGIFDSWYVNRKCEKCDRKKCSKIGVLGELPPILCVRDMEWASSVLDSYEGGFRHYGGPPSSDNRKEVQYRFKGAAFHIGGDHFAGLYADYDRLGSISGLWLYDGRENRGRPVPMTVDQVKKWVRNTQPKEGFEVPVAIFHRVE